MFKKSIFLAVFLVGIFLFPGKSCAFLKVTPLKFHFDVEKNQRHITGALEINASVKKPTRYKIYPGYFEVSEKGQIITDFPKNHVKKDVESIFLSPAEFTLQPGKRQVVRFTIANVDKLPDGESRIAIYIEDKKTKSQALPTPNDKVTATLEIKTRFVVPVYINAGDVEKCGTIQNLALKKSKDKGYEYDLQVESTGNSHIRLNGVVQVLNKKKVIKEFEVKDLPVGDGRKRIIKDLIPLELIENPEKCKIKTKLFYINEKNKKKRLIKEAKFVEELL